MLVDTSIWIDHFRSPHALLVEGLNQYKVCAHSFIIGELSLGHMKNRETILGLLEGLPCLPMAQNDEVRHLIDHHQLYGRGIGYVDAHLLASTFLSSGAKLWTKDKRLHRVASELHLAHEFD